MLDRNGTNIQIILSLPNIFPYIYPAKAKQMRKIGKFLKKTAVVIFFIASVSLVTSATQGFAFKGHKYTVTDKIGYAFKAFDTTKYNRRFHSLPSVTIWSKCGCRYNPFVDPTGVGVVTIPNDTIIINIKYQ